MSPLWSLGYDLYGEGELGGEEAPYYNLLPALLLIIRSFPCAIRTFLRVLIAKFHSLTLQVISLNGMP